VPPPPRPDSFSGTSAMITSVERMFLTGPSRPALWTIWRSGSSSARSAILAPVFSSCFWNLSRRTAFAACGSAMPPPGTPRLLERGVGRPRRGASPPSRSRSPRRPSRPRHPRSASRGALELLAVEVRVGVFGGPAGQPAQRRSAALTGPLELSALGGRFRSEGSLTSLAPIVSQLPRPRGPAGCRRRSTRTTWLACP
jgi:hypothetical protein